MGHSLLPPDQKKSSLFTSFFDKGDKQSATKTRLPQASVEADSSVRSCRGGRQELSTPLRPPKKQHWYQRLRGPTDAETERKWVEVFDSLSEHPSVNNILSRQEKWWKVIELDYYLSTLKSTPWSDLFERTSTLGLIGVRARIVLLIMWIAVEGSSETNELNLVVSSAIQAGFRACKGPEKAPDLQTLLDRYGIMIDRIVEEISRPIPDSIKRSLDNAARTKSPIQRDHYGIDSESSGSPIEVPNVHSKPLYVILFTDEFEAGGVGDERRVIVPRNSAAEHAVCWLIDSMELGCREGQDVASNEGKCYYFSAIMPETSAIISVD